jgi:hypothetical protein
MFSFCVRFVCILAVKSCRKGDGGMLGGMSPCGRSLGQTIPQMASVWPGSPRCAAPCMTTSPPNDGAVDTRVGRGGQEKCSGRGQGRVVDRPLRLPGVARGALAIALIAQAALPAIRPRRGFASAT